MLALYNKNFLALKFRTFSISAVHRIDDNPNPSNEDHSNPSNVDDSNASNEENSETSEHSNEVLAREQLTIEQIIDDRSNEGQNTAEHYEFTPEQRDQLDVLQRRIDLMAGRIYEESRNLDPSHPNSATRCTLLRSGLERHFDNFLNDVDNLTEGAVPVEGDPWHGSADANAAAAESDSYTTDSEHISDDPDYQTVEKYPLRFPAPSSPKRKREESEELLTEEKKEEPVAKRTHLEEDSSSKLPTSTIPEATSPNPSPEATSTNFPPEASSTNSLPEASTANSLPEASSSKPAEDSKPKSSLLDDFADTSTEFPDYTGGDD